jgi:hypothetical protein
MGCLISMLIGTRKLCTLVISMLMSIYILQDVDTYTGRAYENPYMGCLISTLIYRHTKIMHFSHKHPVEHITGCWYIYVRAYENPYMVCLISTLIGKRKLCTLVISMLMSIYILQDVGKYTASAYENPYMGCRISTLIGKRKLCTLVISMLMSILQDVGTYMCVLMRIPTWVVS